MNKFTIHYEKKENMIIHGLQFWLIVHEYIIYKGYSYLHRSKESKLKIYKLMKSGTYPIPYMWIVLTYHFVEDPFGE